MLRSEFWVHGVSLRPSEGGLFDVELTIGSEAVADENVIFASTKNLRIALPDGAPCLLFGVYLDDVSARGWEGIRYSLRQAEQNCIEWDCSEVRVQKL